MNKIGRNDPCSCGSGLKYKKCCISSNVIPFSQLQLVNELNELSQELIEFGYQKYDKELRDTTMDYVEKYLSKNDVSMENYILLLYSWITMNVPVENNQTIFEIFSAWKLSQITNTKVKEVFLSWENAKSSVFEIISMEDVNERNITIREFLSNETYTVNKIDVIELNIGDFIIGTLVPSIESHDFIFNTVIVPQAIHDYIFELLEIINTDPEAVNREFPKWVAVLLGTPEDKLEWLDPLYKSIAIKFTYQMDKKGVDYKEIMYGVLLWNRYSLNHKPHITKINTYAAALDYTINKLFLPENHVTQSALAKEYDVSAGTISTHYKNFIQELEQAVENDTKSPDKDV